MSSDVWFGIHIVPEGLNFETVKRFCLEAEKLDYDLFTIADHFMNCGLTGLGHPLECWTTLAGLAEVTNVIKLGPLVTCYGYREPTVLAKMATTVDIISDGRLIFGIGAGWHEEEFKGFIGRFPPAGERLRGLEETVEICKGMFTNERTTYNGRLYKVDDVLNSPLPIQRPVPIMIGGGGEKRTLKIAARHADITHFLSLGDCKTDEGKLLALRKHCTAIGRDYDEIRKGIGFMLSLGRTEAEAQRKFKSTAEMIGITPEVLRSKGFYRYGTPEKIATAIKEYLDKGFSLITFTLAPWPKNEDIRLLSEELIPLLS